MLIYENVVKEGLLECYSNYGSISILWIFIERIELQNRTGIWGSTRRKEEKNK